MKTTERFEKAVTKLYTAFHDGLLNSFDCHSCAVGTICDGDNKWFFKILSRKIGDPVFPSKKVIDSMYSTFELGRIERIFVDNVPSKYSKNKEYQFKGLCAVVEYLCELDGIPNVMDYSSLFEYNENGAKNKLQTVFG